MRAHDDHEIIASWQIVLHEPERFAKKPLDAIPLYRGTDATGDRQTEARMTEHVGLREADQRSP